MDLRRRLQHLLQNPAELRRQRGERPGELVQQLPRGGARLLFGQHAAQVRRIIVVPDEDHVADPTLTERQQHGRRLGGERRVEDERERGKHHPQPLDLALARPSREERVDHRQLHGSSADRRERLPPRPGRRQGEPGGPRPPEVVELGIGNGA